MKDGQEVLWMSERDGWAHLYLYDGVTGRVKNQMTKGNWLVRAVDKVDEEKRQIWFQASGMYPGKDPYFVHYFRINFDGTGLTRLTEADGDHSVVFSSDMKYYVDTWSRVDLAPVSELRRTDDRQLLMELERGDISALLAAGWRPPEVFTAMGRDGKTDIWGIIHRPFNFDPSKKYPVIESIYAGPQGSFVPKTIQRGDAGADGAGFHCRADRRDGNEQPVEGISRRRVQESRGCGLRGPHSLAPGRRCEVSVLRHQPRRCLRNFGRRSECSWRIALSSGVLQSRRFELGLS